MNPPPTSSNSPSSSTRLWKLEFFARTAAAGAYEPLQVPLRALALLVSEGNRRKRKVTLVRMADDQQPISTSESVLQPAGRIEAALYAARGLVAEHIGVKAGQVRARVARPER